jgi:hypothetical protein
MSPYVLPGLLKAECCCHRAGSRSSNSSSDTFLFTSESVTEGHPDKLCDQVSGEQQAAATDCCLPMQQAVAGKALPCRLWPATRQLAVSHTHAAAPDMHSHLPHTFLAACYADAVLDACLSQDPNSKVACEAAVKDNFLLVFGEITSHAQVEYAAVARQVGGNRVYGSRITCLSGRNIVQHPGTKETPWLPLKQPGCFNRARVFSCVVLTHHSAPCLMFVKTDLARVAAGCE